MATRKGLVNAYAHMWPREVFDAKDVDHKKRLMAKGLEFLNKGGVYVLYREDEPYYIGKAKRLRSRLRHHANNPQARYYHLWTSFSAFAVDDKNDRGEIEGILIAAMPTANSASPKLPKEQLPKMICDLLR